MRVIGMDIHRSFAQAVTLEDGKIVKEHRVELVYGPLAAFAETLSFDDEVVIEVTLIHSIANSRWKLAAKTGTTVSSPFLGLLIFWACPALRELRPFRAAECDRDGGPAVERARHRGCTGHDFEPGDLLFRSASSRRAG